MRIRIVGIAIVVCDLASIGLNLYLVAWLWPSGWSVVHALAIVLLMASLVWYLRRRRAYERARRLARARLAMRSFSLN